MKTTDESSPMSHSLAVRWDLQRRGRLMLTGARMAVEPIAATPGPLWAYVSGWGAAFALAALVVYAFGGRGLMGVIAVGVVAAVANVALRCDSRMRWNPQALWVHAGALTISIPLVVAFAHIALPVTQIVLVLAACALALYLWSAWADSSSGDTTTMPRGANSHMRVDGTPKVGYRYEPEAWAAAEQFEHRTGERMNAYRCGGCPDWHIGHAKA